MTTKKFLGCILGFTGVILVNVTGNGFDFNMTCIGEGMILLSAVSYSFSSVLAKIFSKKDNPVMLSGYQFVLGGIIMLLGSLVAGARFRPFTGKALAVLIYLAFISTFAYSLWTILLKYNDLRSQVYTNSIICSDKFKNYKIGAKAILWALPILTIAFLLLLFV